MISYRNRNFESYLSQSCTIPVVRCMTCRYQIPLFRSADTPQAKYTLAAITPLQSVPGPRAPQRRYGTHARSMSYALAGWALL